MAQDGTRGRAAQAKPTRKAQVLQVANATPLEPAGGTWFKKIDQHQEILLPDRQVPSKRTGGKDVALPTQRLTCFRSREFAQRQVQPEASRVGAKAFCDPLFPIS